MRLEIVDWEVLDLCVYVLSGKETRTQEQASEFLQKIRGRHASFSTWPLRRHWLTYYSKWSPSLYSIYHWGSYQQPLTIHCMEIIKIDHRLETRVYRKKTYKGLLLHFQSNVDSTYKRSLLRSMLDRAKRLSSTPEFLSQEYKNLKGIFLKLKYPEKLIDSAINRVHHPPDLIHTPSDSPIWIIMPYKDQKSADVVRKQLRYLGRKIDHELQPIFTSKKIVDDLRETELKPPIVNQQSVVFEFKCDLCGTNYIGYTRRHLHQRVEEHKHSVIGKHLKDEHNVRPSSLRENFTILKKCRSKLECLIFEMLYIRKKRPKLNTQADSIR